MEMQDWRHSHTSLCFPTPIPINRLAFKISHKHLVSQSKMNLVITHPESHKEKVQARDHNWGM